MSQLGISLFGTFIVTLDGQPIAVPLWSKTRALLAYLAVEAEIPHTRSFLAGLLWSEQSERDAHNSLRQAIYQLRKAFNTTAPTHLLTTCETAQFNQASDHVLDIKEFASLVRQCRQHPHCCPESCPACVERLQRAVKLYRGPFLAGFFLNDSSGFEEWILIKREQYERLALDVFEYLAKNYAQRGDFDKMEQMARWQIEIDPLRESAHRQLMRALAWSGQRAEALADYVYLHKLLAQEVDTLPEKMTTELRNRIEASEERAPVALL